MKVLLSIKPEFAKKIFSGEKKFEFRRALFSNSSVKTVVVYASSPIQKVIGEFDIEQILVHSLEDLWDYTKHSAGINREFYDNYFEGKEIGYAIEISEVRPYGEHLDLEHFEVKQPPQSFMYL